MNTQAFASGLAQTAAAPALRLQNVESAYGPIRAIRGVSLQVGQGRIATVLGSNGAGKSTILKTISGIIDPRKGSIEFEGEDITARDPSLIVQRGLSHVPEGREVFALLSVHDNLRWEPTHGATAMVWHGTSSRSTPTSRSCESALRKTPVCCREGSSRCCRSRVP